MTDVFLVLSMFTIGKLSFRIGFGVSGFSLIMIWGMAAVMAISASRVFYFFNYKDKRF
jgi:hypothetical protein